MTKTLKCPRVRERPDPDSWGVDELLTLAEAVELHWPRGPITVPTLRWAIRNGRLPVCEIAGKFFLTRRFVLDLSAGTRRASAKPGDRPVRPRNGMTESEAKAWLRDERSQNK